MFVKWSCPTGLLMLMGALMTWLPGPANPDGPVTWNGEIPASAGLGINGMNSPGGYLGSPIARACPESRGFWVTIHGEF
jgi:hypothetical protein